MRTTMPLAPATIRPGRRASALRETLSKTWQGLRDGLRAARSYQRLNAMSDAELARRGLTPRGDRCGTRCSASPAAAADRRAHCRFGR